MRFKTFHLALAGLAALLSGCATPPPASDRQALAEYKQQNDAAEPTNRAVFGFNKSIDDNAIKPVAKAYGNYVPDPVRKSVRAFLTNMREPWTFVNEVLQGEFKRSGTTLGRFGANTTVGLFGFFDVVQGKLGPAHEEDFGQTMAVWGIGEGPYLVLPIFGPSNPRDAVGTVVGYVADPASLALALVVPPAGMAGIAVTEGIDKREKHLKDLDEVERTSLDYYASIRSLYRQKRAKDILNGQKSGKLPVIDYGLYEDAKAPAEPPQAAPPAAPNPLSSAPMTNFGVGVAEEQRRMEELVRAMRARAGDLRS